MAATRYTVRFQGRYRFLNWEDMSKAARTAHEISNYTVPWGCAAGGRLFGQAMMYIVLRTWIDSHTAPCRFPVQGQEEMSKFPAIKALYPTKFV